MKIVDASTMLVVVTAATGATAVLAVTLITVTIVVTCSFLCRRGEAAGGAELAAAERALCHIHRRQRAEVPRKRELHG